jgi:antitoxin VapB
VGQLNIKDDTLVAEAKELAALLGTTATGAVREAVRERLERERRARDEAKQRKYEAILAAAQAVREAAGGRLMTNAELDEVLYDPETGLPR